MAKDRSTTTVFKNLNVTAETKEKTEEEKIAEGNLKEAILTVTWLKTMQNLLASDAKIYDDKTKSLVEGWKNDINKLLAPEQIQKIKDRDEKAIEDFVESANPIIKDMESKIQGLVAIRKNYIAPLRNGKHAVGDNKTKEDIDVDLFCGQRTRRTGFAPPTPTGAPKETAIKSTKVNVENVTGVYLDISKLVKEESRNFNTALENLDDHYERQTANVIFQKITDNSFRDELNAFYQVKGRLPRTAEEFGKAVDQANFQVTQFQKEEEAWKSRRTEAEKFRTRAHDWVNPEDANYPKNRPSEDTFKLAKIYHPSHDVAYYTSHINVINNIKNDLREKAAANTKQEKGPQQDNAASQNKRRLT